MQPKLITLDSGITAILVPCEAESVAVGIFVASGSRHESPKFAGISHFIEHMLFKGTPTRRAIDIIRAIEGRGGNFNAYTSEESTCFFAHLPDDYLLDAIDILCDMYLNASIDPEEFEKEKRVIIEEIRMYRDEPESVAAENLQRAIFPRNQLGAPIAGSEESLLPLTPDDLHDYINRHYLASKTVIVISGSFKESKAISKLNAVLPKGIRKAPSFKTPKVDFSIPPVHEIIVKKEVNQTQLMLGYRTFGCLDERKYPAAVLDGILGRGMSSRLFQEVREKYGLSYDIGSRWQFFKDAGMLSIGAGVDPGKAAIALEVINKEIDRLVQKRLTPADLKRTKEYLIGNFRISNEKALTKMLFYAGNYLSQGRLVLPSEQIEKVREVTADQVRDVARVIFSADNSALSWVMPKE